MLKKSIPFILPALIAVAGSAFGQNAAPPVNSDALKKVAFDHFYNLEYDQAIEGFHAVAAMEPDRPSAWNHIAQVLFYDSLFRAGMMGSDLIKSNDALMKAPKVAMSSQRDSEIQSALAKSMSLCQALLKTNAKDPSAIYEMGNAFALRANYVFLVRHSWLDGLKDANQSRRLHEQLLKLEPGNYDARLIPGTHEYMVGTLPLIVRMFARTAGLSGNRDKGLHMVEDVAQHGQVARTDAEILLPALYRRENRSKDGIPEMRKLADEYPRNFLFRIELAKFYTDAGQKPMADAELRRIQELIDEKAPGYVGDRVPLIRKKEAEVAQTLGQRGTVDVPASNAFAAGER